MSDWYQKISSAAENDWTALGEALVYYEDELEQAKKEVRIGGIIENSVATLPAYVESRQSQWQEVEAILRFLEIKYNKIKNVKFRKYLEGYARALTPTVAEKYAEAEDDVIDLQLLINHVALVRNKYMAVNKALDNKNFQLSNVVKLRTAGMDDAEIDPIYVKIQNPK